MYGDNIAILSIVPFLVKKGIEPYFLTLTKSEFTDRLNELGYGYLCGYDVMKPGMWPRFKNLRELLSLIKRCIFVYRQDYKRLKNAVEKLKPDIIHSNLSYTALGYCLARDLKIPHVWHVREYGDLDHDYRQFPTKARLQKKLSDCINKTIFITDDIYRYYGSPKNGCAIYDGVIKDPSVIPVIKEEDNGYFLYVGRLVQTKGVENLIKTFLRYTDTTDYPIPLKIAGKGSEEFEYTLRKICSEHNNGHLVEFLGYRSDVAELMSSARALIVSSKFEAFGFISAEAMYNGCPVIGHNVAGTMCQFDNGLSLVGSEIGFRYSDEDELLQSLMRLSRCSRSDLIPMLKKAQTTVLHFYSAEKSADEVMKVYNQAIGIRF